MREATLRYVLRLTYPPPPPPPFPCALLTKRTFRCWRS
jgi:hypothetical protein